MDEVRRLLKTVQKLSLEDLERLENGVEEAKANKKREEAEATKAEFWADLHALMEVIASTPLLARDQVAEMESRAASFGACERVQILGLRAFMKKLLGDLPGAEADLREAWVLVPLCPTGFCRLDVLRRQAKLDIQAKRGQEALRNANECLAGYRALGGPGHDLYGAGEAHALLARGDILIALGEHEAAVEDIRESLRLFQPGSREWAAAHQNLAVALLGVGNEAREEAYQMLASERHQFKRRTESVEWASFWWVDSQLTIVTGRRADRAIKKLEEVADCYHGQRMPVHRSAVLHDIARTYFPSTGDIKALLSRAEIEIDQEVHNFFSEIWALAQVCPPTPGILGRLDAALRSLRSLLTIRSPTLAPCLVGA